ncbi:hypothetical protein MRS44_012075 [Fusarium solani]|uniref:uncharacterized protein n=1 Tax=Fusarium solani TaxID=169388 RepID=UPI0032C4665A|nr:hypothetical protein MRS44_012075 [Fusarium solani]
MGFPDPRILTPEPEPEPETTADRAQAMQIPRLAWGMTDQQYAGRRVAREYGLIAVDLAFRGQRRRHKRFIFVPTPMADMGTAADLAETEAGYAFEQELVSLLAHNKWRYGYVTLRSRRKHEGHAGHARKAAIDWARVAKMQMLQDAEAHAMTARIVALRNDLKMQRPRIVRSDTPSSPRTAWRRLGESLIDGAHTH